MPVSQKQNFCIHLTSNAQQETDFYNAYFLIQSDTSRQIHHLNNCYQVSKKPYTQLNHDTYHHAILRHNIIAYLLNTYHHAILTRNNIAYHQTYERESIFHSHFIAASITHPGYNRKALTLFTHMQLHSLSQQIF